MEIVKLGAIAVAWLVYFILHSVLASLQAKAWVAAHLPHLAPYYRLSYNLLALGLLIPPLALLHAFPGEPLWAWNGTMRVIMDGLALGALAGFAWSLRYYDMGAFLGLSRARGGSPHTRFTLSPFHRYVRHPWYSFGLVIIWTRDMGEAWLVSCVAITAYLAIGSYLEERKLLGEFGEPYRLYQKRVPGLIPLPGRHLSAAEAAKLAAEANQPQTFT